MADKIPYIRVFVSSPGDVNDERKIVLEVIEQLPYRPTFREKVAFRVIAWDKPGAGTPMRATLTPQEAINRGLPTPAECDIVIVLFWSRMGTPFTDQDGKTYQSGTHWELLNALAAKRPETVIYHRADKPPFDVTDRDFDAKHAQYKAVKAFFESDLFYGADGSIRRGVNTYQTPDDFRRAFEIDLEVLVLDILNRLETALSPEPELPDIRDDDNISTIRAVAWPPGRSPFPGLRAFQEQDADIFFGRGYETDALVRQLTGSRFVAVVGASGSGKSSLVGAGLIPRLRANAIPGSKDWTIARFTPGDAPFVNLAEALLHGLPSLRLGDLLRAKADVVSLVENALENQPEWVEVLLFVDQFEELFTLASRSDAQAFADLLDAIADADSERMRVVVTMRADFYHRAVEYAQLAALLRAGSFPLAIPKRDALRQMIERPAERAGLTFDHALVGRMLDDTGDEPGNLALMAYALDELYKLDEDRRLTHEEYERLGGVLGAIGTRAENTFLELGLTDNVLQRVFHTLVEVDERGTATRRREQFQREQLDEETQRLITAFTDARLLTTSSDAESQTATVEVAHEAILRSWLRLAGWIEDTQDGLRLLRQVRNAAAEWHEKGRPDYLLWPHERLIQVYAMQERLNPELSKEEHDFVKPEHERLLRELDDLDISHLRRSNIGERLSVIGDPRPGVGLRPDGVPDIAWCLVPGDEIRLEDKVFTVPSFYIAKYPITHIQFQAFLQCADGFEQDIWWEGVPTPYRKHPMLDQMNKFSSCPRDSVSLYQAEAFCRWLSWKMPTDGCPERKITLGNDWIIRLPTEREWQQAATGGDSSYQYPWGQTWDGRYANTREAGIRRTTAVGMYTHGISPVGVLDMSGNIWEWCQGSHLHGGSYFYSSQHAKIMYRDYFDPASRRDEYGFRIVMASPDIPSIPDLVSDETITDDESRLGRESENLFLPEDMSEEPEESVFRFEF